MTMTELAKYIIAVEVLEKEQAPLAQRVGDLIHKKFTVGLTRDEQELLTMSDKANQQYQLILADLRHVAGLDSICLSHEELEEDHRAVEEAHASVSEWLAGYGE